MAYGIHTPRYVWPWHMEFTHTHSGMALLTMAHGIHAHAEIYGPAYNDGSFCKLEREVITSQLVYPRPSGVLWPAHTCVAPHIQCVIKKCWFLKYSLLQRILQATSCDLVRKGTPGTETAAKYVLPGTFYGLYGKTQWPALGCSANMLTHTAATPLSTAKQ